MRGTDFKGGRNRRGFRPRGEMLEARQCLSVTVSTVVVGGQNELKIVGDKGADTIDITDEGNGTISVADGNGNTLGSGTGISRILFNGKNGTDTVNYSLANPLTNTESIYLELGSGGPDIAGLDFSAGVSNANLYVHVDGGPKADTISATLGSLTSAHVSLDLDGGAGDDSITVSGAPVNVDAAAVHSAKAVHARRSTPPRRFRPLGTVNIDANSSLRIDARGGRGADTITTTLEGQILGKLIYNAEGGRGADTLVANITADAGSTGKVSASENGGPGVDNVTLNVNDNSGGTGGSTLAALHAKIFDYGGNDTLTNTPNVKVITHHPEGLIVGRYHVEGGCEAPGSRPPVFFLAGSMASVDKPHRVKTPGHARGPRFRQGFVLPAFAPLGTIGPETGMLSVDGTGTRPAFTGIISCATMAS